MQLLFGGSNPPLGGPGYLDPLTIISVFTAAFALSIVFTTILLMRTREEYIAAPGNRHAVRVGLRETAAAATGAGLVMVAALIPFSTTDFINIRVLGVGIAVAVLLDVAIMRPVLLPAAEAVLGRYGWWPTQGGRGRRNRRADRPRRRLLAGGCLGRTFATAPQVRRIRRGHTNPFEDSALGGGDAASSWPVRGSSRPGCLIAARGSSS